MFTYNEGRTYKRLDETGHLVDVRMPDFTPEQAIFDLYVRTFKRSAPDSWQEALREIDAYLNQPE